MGNTISPLEVTENSEDLANPALGQGCWDDPARQPWPGWLAQLLSLGSSSSFTTAKARGRDVLPAQPGPSAGPAHRQTHSGHPSKVETVKSDIMAEKTLSKWKLLCIQRRFCCSICVGSPST